MGQYSASVDLSPASEAERLCLSAWMKPSLLQGAATCGHQQRPKATPPASVPEADRAMEVSGGGHLRNAMIGLLA
jgi:hypothetical protein